MRRVQYYGCHAERAGRRTVFVEVLYTREATRPVEETRTGRTYRTMREARTALADKNSALWITQLTDASTTA